MKRLFSLVLLLWFCFTILADNLTVYFINTQGWSNVNAYIWPTDGDGIVKWPGTPMKLEDGIIIDGCEVYSYTFNYELFGDVAKGTADNIIFNCGMEQTPDLWILDVTKTYYYNWEWCQYNNLPEKVIKYSFDDEKNMATVIKGGDYFGNVEIPSSITFNSKKYIVTSIEEKAFSGCSNLKSVTIPSSVTSIGASAFQDCTNLTSITIPNSVTSIGDYAFENCSGLSSVSIGNNVTSIGDDAFSYCSGLTSITIGKNVTSIGGRAFKNCSGLSTVTIPNSVISIGARAFEGCSGLTSVTIPNSVTSIKQEAFSGCSGLTSVTIGNNVTSIGGYAFNNCSGLTSVIWNAKNCANFEDERSSPFFNVSSQIISFIFGDDVEHIPSYLCYYMNNLKELVIPNGVISIGDYVFYGAGLHNMESIWDKGVFYVSNYLVAAKKNKMVGNYSIKEGTKVILPGAFQGCELLSSIIIPNSVSSIGSGAFGGCSGLTKVNYLGTVDEWVEIDFEDSNSNPTAYYAKDLYINNELLTDVKITTADSIKNYAFYICKSIKSVEIGNSVTSIGGYAFSYCSGLTSVSIGNNVTSIGDDAFSYCSGLSTVTIPNSVISIGASAFEGCSGLTSVTIPNSVTSIEQEAFSGCSGLTSVTIGNNVTSIGGGAFSYCSGLTSITIPNSVTSIGYGKYTGCAFRGCSSLTSVVWNARNCANFEDEESSPFYNEKGSNITSFTIGDDVETIPTYLCNNLVNLKNLTIGRNLNSIGDYAFEGCRNLERITIFNEEVPMASYNSFVNYDANLYVLCDAYADYYFDIPFGYFKVQCIEADKIEYISKIDVDIDENNNVIISWPSEFGAENYELIISKNIESIKQYNFDSKGQLLSIDSNYRSAHAGFSFTVSGLESGNKYNYKAIALDKNGNILKEYVGEFEIKEIVEIIENLADANISIIDGLITIADTDFSIYNISGQDVTSYNGNLSPGVYIVKNEEIITKVMIR